MTDRIDLDELDSETESDEDAPNRGDWFWKDDGDFAEEDISVETKSGTTTEPSADDSTAAEGTSDDAQESKTERQRTPHVPRSNKGNPAGIPVEQGGSGGGATAGRNDGSGGSEKKTAKSDEGEEASGPHGRGADDMTLAMSYEAAKRLADPESVFAEARGWADWVGIVGDVNAPVINKFQRDNRLDLDFFNGTGSGPGERLAEIDGHSMFLANRMVLVGIDGEEHIAEAADWEFVPLAEAAEAADWEIKEASVRE